MGLGGARERSLSPLCATAAQIGVGPKSSARCRRRAAVAAALAVPLLRFFVCLFVGSGPHANATSMALAMARSTLPRATPVLAFASAAVAHRSAAADALRPRAPLTLRGISVSSSAATGSGERYAALSTARFLRQRTFASSSDGGGAAKASSVDPEVERIVDFLAEGPCTLLDVRTAEEFSHGSVPDAVNIPVQELAARIGELPRGSRLAVFCAAGVRSKMACNYLEANGFRAEDCINVPVMAVALAELQAE
eukprot:TRINITY_DN57889_c0_g1_i1.p1 TRINITY_DN57889_c0_g1~~TRINITY_DN57889_c0_g1_i1.p1  ORF type:complete len:260 (-),score=66.67 TRINITY_DN57889_c0_g1_i1:111-866(-)